MAGYFPFAGKSKRPMRTGLSTRYACSRDSEENVYPCEGYWVFVFILSAYCFQAQEGLCLLLRVKLLLIWISLMDTGTFDMREENPVRDISMPCTPLAFDIPRQLT